MRNPIVALLTVVGTILVLGGCVVEDDEGERHVSLSAECSWYAGVECEAACQEFSYHLACEGEINVACAPTCSEFEISVDCSANCQASCEASCEANPGSFSCEGYCQGNCEGSCKAECEAHDNTAACQGECAGFCQGECSIGCEGEPPQFSCSGSCGASCEGQCTAEANIDCHFCDVDIYLECSHDLKIDCDLGCDAEGVFECDGEFIDRGDIEDAIAHIKAHMPEVQITAEGEAGCYGNTCEARGSCEAQCVAAGGAGGATRPGLVLLLAGLAALFAVRRRR